MFKFNMLKQITPLAAVLFSSFLPVMVSAYTGVEPLFPKPVPPDYSGWNDGLESISADGNMVSYCGSYRGVTGAFVVDRSTGVVHFVSNKQSSTKFVRCNGGSVDISADGRYVAFITDADGIVEGDNDGLPDLFLHDLTAGATKLISKSVSLGPASVRDGYGPSISGNGRFVAFDSKSSNLVPGDANHTHDVFVYDQMTDSIELVSVDNDGVQLQVDSLEPSISEDGRYVVFMAHTNDFSDSSYYPNLFIRDRVAHTTTRITVGVDGLAPNGDIALPEISGNGRYVVYTSTATNLTAEPWTGQVIYHIYRYDRLTGNTVLVKIPNPTILLWPTALSISESGRYVVFTALSHAGEDYVSNIYDVYIYDFETGASRIIDRWDLGSVEKDLGDSQSVAISGDGKSIVFQSTGDAIPPPEGPHPGLYSAGNPLYGLPSLSSPIPSQRLAAANIPAGSGTNRNAVLIAHGWNSDAESWAKIMADSICRETLEPIQKNVLKKVCSIGTNGNTDVWVVDWEDDAGTVTPWWGAYKNASVVGDGVGKYLEPVKYSHLHLIAHSAGSNLIDHIKDHFKRRNRSNPTIHMTFLDAYDPASVELQKDATIPIDVDKYKMSTYGNGADWVDNYIDSRPLLDTNLLMRGAFNIDVSKSDINFTNDSSKLKLVSNHAWPYKFYQERVDYFINNAGSVSGDETGYRFARESNDPEGLALLKHKANNLCILESAGASECPDGALLDISNLTRKVSTSRRVVNTLHSYQDGVKQLTQKAKGAAGTVIDAYAQATENMCTSAFFRLTNPSTCFWATLVTQGSSAPLQARSLARAGESASLGTGPAWVEYEMTLDEPVNSLSFEYAFDQGSGGRFSIWFDGLKIRDVDQSYLSGEVRKIDNLPLEDVVPGTHRLGFRLEPDPQTGAATRVHVAGIKFEQRTAERVAPVLPLSLRHNQWQQIGIPCKPATGEETVAKVLADDIYGELNKDWAVFRYSPAQGRYIALGLDDALQPGTGYWVIQLSDLNPVNLDLPPSCTKPTPVTSTACASPNGCYEAPLETGSGNVSWNMAAYPFDHPTEWSSMRVVDEDKCKDGCTLDEAEARNVIYNQGWQYDAEKGNYQTLKNGSLDAWFGYWIAALQDAKNPKLLVPVD